MQFWFFLLHVYMNVVVVIIYQSCYYLGVIICCAVSNVYRVCMQMVLGRLAQHCRYLNIANRLWNWRCISKPYMHIDLASSEGDNVMLR